MPSCKTVIHIHLAIQPISHYLQNQCQLCYTHLPFHITQKSTLTESQRDDTVREMLIKRHEMHCTGFPARRIHMFSEMRRKDREMTQEDTIQLLRDAEYGELVLNGRNGYPHPIPISYAYKNGALWFHCAQEGSKLEDLRADARAAFTVVGPTEVIPEKFTTKFSSVICYGELSEAVGDEIGYGLLALVEKYSPEFLAEGRAYIERSQTKTGVLRMDIRHMTGKARR